MRLKKEEKYTRFSRARQPPFFSIPGSFTPTTPQSEKGSFGS
jgi:hypothetical protein